MENDHCLSEHLLPPMDLKPPTPFPSVTETSRTASCASGAYHQGSPWRRTRGPPGHPGCLAGGLRGVRQPRSPPQQLKWLPDGSATSLPGPSWPLPFQRTLEQFDFAFQPSIDERTVRELANLAFVTEATNILLLGPPGVGKTHLAVALGHQVHRGRTGGSHLLMSKTPSPRGIHRSSGPTPGT